ncbi:MAG: hypothetical protein ACXABO_08250 [Promethearchaeota archaeon]|jgi:hypothetical protein
MKSNRLTLFNIAKYINYELLIEGLVLKKGTTQSDSFEKLESKNKSLKFRIYRVKILYAIIFGILPIAPLLGYFEIADFLINSTLSVEIIIFHGSLFISLFFTLQIFNFILMGMLEVSMIMSGQILEWLKTLPIPRNKLKKIVLFTIFRSFDIPLVVIIMAFPIIMYIGTLSLIIFLISIGISILNAIFSFSILVIIGSRMNRTLGVNQLNTKRSHTIRILNFVSYAVGILGSMYLIQWAFSSIDDFFIMFLNLNSPALTNVVLSSIPYPFNPSYLVLVSIVSNRVPSQLWVSCICGLIIFTLITWWIFRKALKQVGKLTFSSHQNSSSSIDRKKVQVDIKSTSPLKAHLRKDLVQISHDFKSFIAVITTFLLSFLFSYYFNLGNIGRSVPTEILTYTNWVGLLLINPIISGMLIFNFLSFEETGQSILISLPIIPHDQAKAKLYLILLFQTFAVILPTVMYIQDPKFGTFIMATLGALPLIWTFTLALFEMKVNFFGKKRHHYVIEEFNSNNKMFKWTIIICIQYFLAFWVISSTFNIYVFAGYDAMATFWAFISFLGLIISFMIFRGMFPIFSIRSIMKEEVRKWFKSNFLLLIDTLVSRSLEKGHLLSERSSIKIIKEKYLDNSQIPRRDEFRVMELEKLVYFMIDEILDAVYDRFKIPRNERENDTR